jgi:AcrR family transcriptional regulator
MTAPDLRGRLLEVGDRVFAEKGYAGATVDDVITGAETSRASFYRYFKSKEDLFRELSRECFVEMRAIVRGFGALGPAPVEAAELERLVALYLDLHRRRGGVVRAWTERTAPPGSPARAEAVATFDALLGEMVRALETAGVASRVDSEIRAALLFLAIERSCFYVTNRHSRVDPARLAPSLATMLQRAYFGTGGGRSPRRLRVAGGP